MQTLQEITGKTDNKAYTIVRLSRENVGDLAILHSQVYKVPVNKEYFQKKYDTAYTGVEYVGYIAYNRQNMAVAYYGVIPCFIQYERNILLAAQSADTMTHPEHRYKGMFVELSNKAFDLCKELGIRLIFGFPNQNSYHGAVNKLGWKMTETMSCFMIPVKGLRFVALMRKMKWSKKIDERFRQFIIRKKIMSLPGVANSVITDGYAGVCRDEQYFIYKSYNRTKVISIGEAKIWISYKNGLLIGDIENLDSGNFEMVIRQLKQIARQSGLNNIQLHCCAETNLYKLFSANFTPSASYPVLFQDFGFPIAPEKIKFTFADIDIF